MKFLFLELKKKKNVEMRKFNIVEEFNPISQEWVKSFYENDKKVINKVENEDSGKDEKSAGE